MMSAAHPIEPEMLMALLDGELSADEATSVRAHVADCAMCARLAAEMALLSPRLAAWHVEPAPATLVVPGPTRRWRLLSSWVSPLAGRPSWTFAGVTAVVIVLAAVAWQGGREPSLSHLTVAVGQPAPPAAAEALRVGGAGQTAGTTPHGDAAGESLAPDRLIVTSVTLHMVTREFDRARATLDRTVRVVGGFIGEISIRGTEETSRFLSGTIRVPAAALEPTLAALRGAGQVQEEARRSDDVTEGVRDVEARLANARAAEQRIVEILARRTGTLTDVLAAERELARMRGEIERLHAERQNVLRQVQFAAISLQIRELRPESLQTGQPPLTGRLRDAFVRGVRRTGEGLASALLLVAGMLPALAILAVVMVPIVVAVRRRRARAAR